MKISLSLLDKFTHPLPVLEKFREDFPKYFIES